MDDPKAYTKPWTVTLKQRIVVDTELLDCVCLENERIRNTLLPDEITLLLMPARVPSKGVTQKIHRGGEIRRERRSTKRLATASRTEVATSLTLIAINGATGG